MHHKFLLATFSVIFIAKREVNDRFEIISYFMFALHCFVWKWLFQFFRQNFFVFAM